jgi:hypothetical protein
VNKCLFYVSSIVFCKKGKAIPVTGREGPFSPDNRLTDGGKVVSLTRPLPFTPQEDS